MLDLAFRDLRFLRLGRMTAGALSAYAVAGFTPELVFDFGAEFYAADSASTTFDSAMTAARTTNATMVDSDGLIKWAPHNLLAYSEQFDNTAWLNGTVSANTDVAPNGEITADTITLATVTSRTQDGALAISPGDTFTFSIWLKRGSATTVRLGVSRSGAGTFEQSLSPVITLTSDFVKHQVTHTFANSQTGFRVFITNADATTQAFVAWGAHFYRSDLGGMVNNPDRGDSYVPTTTAARYLPRRGHHIYDGAAWVSEGLLVEPTAGTNLEELSQAFNSWTKTNVTVSENSAVSPTGETDASTVTSSAAGNSASLTNVTNFTSTAATYTFSCYLKAGTTDDVELRLLDQGTASYSAAYDLTNGTATVVQGAVSGTSIEDVGNGWYRCSISFAFPAGGSDTAAIRQGASAASGSTFLVFGAQVELGSVPSSYIPTTGATATRAAETLTIPAANLPYPTPTFIGAELVTNGTFDTDTAGWTAVNGTIAVVDQTLEVTGDGGFNDLARQQISTVIGKVYLVTGQFRQGTQRAQITVANSAAVAIASASTTETTFQDISLPFVATTEITRIDLVLSSSPAGTAYFDNISVREINPLSVSIQMDGRVTWVDTNSVIGGGVAYQWRKDANDFLYNAFNSSGSTQGTYAVQGASGVNDISSGFTNINFGVFQPFSIASRHGSTFLNSASAGSTLTADTTPVAFPALSTTDMNLRLSGGPMTIKRFRMWADDLGDAGIAEGSA